ncbi:MAG: hypothetical protein Tp182DCM212571_8 [Prokaryotic dsDNA virus sp.]|mgnify:CR=1 FL=1|nr:MAG: hypothetical protein Tp182DCM212571_8 [Prokaryotic dsDNA virus sp.]|tara:strand:- start:3546 stop:4358 length:813 start_codon:yes stop_codon:yes gene_type:complete
MDTRNAVIAQLRENTGAHMLDSGGAYGRGFERWAKVTDDTALSAPPVTVHPDYLTINTPQWLADRAEVQPKLTRAFRLWAALTDPEDSEPWLVTMERFAERIREIDGSTDYEGVHGSTVNTYNHDSMLDEVLQYVIFVYRGNYYMLLQTHNGCDLRGGYSSPVVYMLDEPYRLFDEQVTAWHSAPEEVTLDGLEFDYDSHTFDLRNGESWTDMDGSSVLDEHAPKIMAYPKTGAGPVDPDSIPYTDHEDYEFALQCPCGMRMDVTRDQWQ